MARPKVDEVLEEAKKALDAWQKIPPPQPQFFDLTVSVLYNAVEEAVQLHNQLTSLENDLVNVRNRRDDSNKVLAGHLKRLRAGMKAFYGDNSSQYEMVGGTRASEKKSGLTRKTTTTA